MLTCLQPQIREAVCHLFPVDGCEGLPSLDVYGYALPGAKDASLQEASHSELIDLKSPLRLLHLNFGRP